MNNQSDADDDSSAGSDEDTDLWKLKKSKYFANRTSDKDFEISDVIKSPVRPNKMALLKVIPHQHGILIFMKNAKNKTMYGVLF